MKFDLSSREYAGPVFPYWLRSTWTVGIYRFWDYHLDVGFIVDEETGEILVWRYRSPQEGGTIVNCFRTSPLPNYKGPGAND